jgi:hypothetical protein
VVGAPCWCGVGRLGVVRGCVVVEWWFARGVAVVVWCWSDCGGVGGCAVVRWCGGVVAVCVVVVCVGGGVWLWCVWWWWRRGGGVVCMWCMAVVGCSCSVVSGRLVVVRSVTALGGSGRW